MIFHKASKARFHGHGQNVVVVPARIEDGSTILGTGPSPKFRNDIGLMRGYRFFLGVIGNPPYGCLQFVFAC